jgi:hypothetical protein
VARNPDLRDRRPRNERNSQQDQETSPDFIITRRWPH